VFRYSQYSYDRNMVEGMQKLEGDESRWEQQSAAQGLAKQGSPRSFTVLGYDRTAQDRVIISHPYPYTRHDTVSQARSMGGKDSSKITDHETISSL
jgi:hypothetical protein